MPIIFNNSGGGGSGGTTTSLPATAITTNDAGAYYTATQVEATLQEIGETNAAKNDNTGFVNTTDSTITFIDSTRTLSLQPTATNFTYYIDSIKYISTGDTLVITDVEGIHIVYMNATGLAEIVNPTPAETAAAIKTKAFVSIIYWDATNNEGIYVGEERHGLQMSGATHSHFHFTLGATYRYGLALNTMDVDGSGDDATAAQFGVDSGAIADEDLYGSISAVSATTGLPVYYMLGAGANWRRDVNTGYSVVTFDGTTGTRLCYNQYTGGAWQKTQVSNNDFALYHIFATTEKDKPMISIMGQAVYANRIAARAGAETEMNKLILNDIMFPETRPIATLIYQTNDSYSNNVKSRIRATEDGDNYVDWRNRVISRIELTTDDHNSLAGLQGGTTDEYYHLTSAQKTVVDNTSGTNTGDQDLTALALKSNVLEKDNTDSYTPSADYHPATKKYVDDSTPVITEIVKDFVVNSGKTVTANDIVQFVNGGIEKAEAGDPSYGTATVFENATTDYISCCALSDSKVFISYQDYGNSRYGTGIVGEISGTTITYGTTVVFENANTQYISCCALSDSKVFIGYQDGGNFNYGTGIAYSHLSDFSDFGKIIGISKDTVTGNGTLEASVGIAGELTGLTGLTQNSIYYFNNGNLSISSGDCEMGLATSTTKLIYSKQYNL